VCGFAGAADAARGSGLAELVGPTGVEGDDGWWCRRVSEHFINSIVREEN
jgi:hypothetical protein